MGGEQFVVELRIHELAVGLRQLNADQEGFDAADEEEEHGGCAVHDAELLVVDGKEPALPALGLHRAMEAAGGLLGRHERSGRQFSRTFNDCHGCRSYFNVVR